MAEPVCLSGCHIPNFGSLVRHHAPCQYHHVYKRPTIKPACIQIGLGPILPSASYFLPAESMSFHKIPILLPSVLLFNISFMSPNAPPDESERIHGAFYERICPALFPTLHRVCSSRM